MMEWEVLTLNSYLSFQFHSRCILLLQFVCRLISTLWRIHYLLYTITLFETTCSAANMHFIMPNQKCNIEYIRTWKFYINLVSANQAKLFHAFQHKKYTYNSMRSCWSLVVFLVNKNRKQLSTMAVGCVLRYILTKRYTISKILCSSITLLLLHYAHIL